VSLPFFVAVGVAIETVVSAPVRVRGDEQRLRQVVWNLLLNSLKFTPTEGHVQVRLVHTGCNVNIVVTDTGQGIAADILPHLFQRFRQGDSTPARPHGGLGLGLAIARHIVELHGGTISAQSAGTGKGATFCVTLPAEDTGTAQCATRAAGSMMHNKQLETPT
jgi:signal transduction histidine kinase